MWVVRGGGVWKKHYHRGRKSTMILFPGETIADWSTIALEKAGRGPAMDRKNKSPELANFYSLIIAVTCCCVHLSSGTPIHNVKNMQEGGGMEKGTVNRVNHVNSVQPLWIEPQHFRSSFFFSPTLDTFRHRPQGVRCSAPPLCQPFQSRRLLW